MTCAHPCCIAKKEREEICCWELIDTNILLASWVGHRLLYLLRCLEFFFWAPASQHAGTNYRSPNSIEHRHFATLWRALRNTMAESMNASCIACSPCTTRQRSKLQHDILTWTVLLHTKWKRYNIHIRVFSLFDRVQWFVGEIVRAYVKIPIFVAISIVFTQDPALPRSDVSVWLSESCTRFSIMSIY
jgi:hypothetical protein